MALTASAPVLTARGDQLNEADGFISKFEVVKRVSKEVTEESKTSAHAVLGVGKCEDITLDSDTGFVGMSAVLQYTELLCTADAASLKRCAASWHRKPTAMAITATLLRRDRGASQFLRVEHDEADVFVHPAQLLSNVEVGASTRTWLVSTAAFALSYHQIARAYEQSPKDFARIDEHVEALTARVNVLGSRHGMRKLSESALSSVKTPYADFDYTSMAQEAVSRLSLLARADLAAMKYLRKHPPRRVGEDGKPSKKGGCLSTPDVTVEQLRFLKDIAAANGDLWFERSVHAYGLGEHCGAVIVFPSGHLHSIIGSAGTTVKHLLKERTALARMESLIPYIPYELSGYSGDISRLALLSAQTRKGAPSKIFTKADLETAKAAISAYAVNLTMAMIVDPVMIDLLRRAERKASDAASAAVSVEAPPPEPVKKAALPTPLMVVPVLPEDPEDEDEEDEVFDE